MKRREFIKTTAVGSSLLTTHSLFSSLVVAQTGKENVTLIDPIIPFEFYPDFEKKIVSSLIYLRQHYGFRRFIMAQARHKEFRYTGFPEKQVFIEIGEQISHLQEQLSPYDIEVGWWCATTIRIGKGDFQSIVRIDGSIAQEAVCPLDPDYQETFSDYIATVVQIARPFLVNFEDDYHMVNGCFCPRHLEEFAKRQNRYYSREVLQTELHAKTFEGYKLEQAWGELKRDSLAILASSVREKVDQIAPETRLMLCEHGASESEGNFAEAVTQAFAGNTRPAIRTRGTNYFSDDPLSIPRAMFRPLYQRQHLPANFELFHESDTFPHTRFFMSSSFLKSLMTAAFAYGFDNSLLYVNQYLENPLEEDGYRNMFKKELNRFTALKLAVKGCYVDGCEIFREPATSFNWVQIMGRLGIPYTSVEANVKLVSGEIIERMNEEDIKELLRGNVFFDGYSALQVCKKGLGRLIGAELSSREDTLLPPFYEGIRNPERYANINNRLMYNYLWAWRTQTSDPFYRIEPLAGAEIITDFLNTKNQPLYPGMIRFENELGGRIGVMAYNLNDSYVCSRSISMFNYSKKELIRQVIEWIGKESLPVFVRNIPNAFCIFNRSESNDYAIVVVTGLNSDTFESLSLDVAPEWINSKFELLNNDGRWCSVSVETRDRTIKVNTQVSLMDPVILRFTK